MLLWAAGGRQQRHCSSSRMASGSSMRRRRPPASDVEGRGVPLAGARVHAHRPGPGRRRGASNRRRGRRRRMRCAETATRGAGVDRCCHGFSCCGAAYMRSSEWWNHSRHRPFCNKGIRDLPPFRTGVPETEMQSESFLPQLHCNECFEGESCTQAQSWNQIDHQPCTPPWALRHSTSLGFLRKSFETPYLSRTSQASRHNQGRRPKAQQEEGRQTEPLFQTLRTRIRNPSWGMNFSSWKRTLRKNA